MKVQIKSREIRLTKKGKLSDKEIELELEKMFNQLDSDKGKTHDVKLPKAKQNQP